MNTLEWMTPQEELDATGTLAPERIQELINELASLQAAHHELEIHTLNAKDFIRDALDDLEYPLAAVEEHVIKPARQYFTLDDDTLKKMKRVVKELNEAIDELEVEE
jgi:hypothetical protein